MILTEHQVQVSFISWCNFPPNIKQYPELELFYAIPNGAYCKHGGFKKMLEAEGQKSGVPDIELPVSRGIYHGFYLEFKRNDKEKLKPDQVKWSLKLTAQGRLVITVSSRDTAISVTKAYLKLKPGQEFSKRG